MSKSNFTSSFSSLETNPWEHDSKSVTAIKNTLILASQMGFQTVDDEREFVKQIANLQSSRIIAKQKEISSKNRSLRQLQRSIAKHKQQEEVSDFIHINKIERRINMVKQLCTDLDSVLQNTEVLINRLQKPFVGEYIKMNAQYHKHAYSVLNGLIPSLNDLSLVLDNIIWAANNTFSSKTLEPLLVDVQSLTATTQTSKYTLDQMRHGVESLILNQGKASSLQGSLHGTPKRISDG